MTSSSERAEAVIARVPRVPHVVTIGNFDGVHRGHQYLIGRVIEDAARRGARSLVITFEPHPTSVLRPDVPFERLTTPEDKLALIRATGVDDVTVLPFDREFAALEPDEFLTLINDAVQPVSVFVGEGFRFGRGRAGDGESIAAFGDRHGFDTTIIARLRDEGAMISSSSIREALARGDVAQANDFLGRRYRLRGTVEHGAARGRELGFPTANLLVPPGLCVPSDGIYAAYAHVSAPGYGARQAMVYIGSRPTFDNGERMVEVNLLDFSGDLYTLELEAELVAFVRGDATFASAAELARQMQHDETKTRELLSATEPERGAREGGE